VSEGPSGAPPPAISVIRSIGEVAPAEWDACAGRANPSLCHAYLQALETAGAIGEGKRLMPRHLLTRDREGRIAAAIPAVLQRGPRAGEFQEDAWAAAYEAQGRRYYPALAIEAPLMPMSGPRILLRDPADTALRDALIAALPGIARRNGLAAVNAFHVDAQDIAALRAAEWLVQTQLRFQWTNAGYDSFDDFLAALKNDRRRSICRERRELRAAGITVRTVAGGAIDAGHCRRFHRLYAANAARKGTVPSLTLPVLEAMAETMADRMLFFLAFAGDTPVGATFCLLGPDTLYARHWGGVEGLRFVHFETTYYQAIELAIARGLKRIDGGVGGPHKLARGFMPEPIHAAHRPLDPALHRAVARYLEAARPALDAAFAAHRARSPYAADRRLASTADGG